jgi:hypothetical protein
MEHGTFNGLHAPLFLDKLIIPPELINDRPSKTVGFFHIILLHIIIKKNHSIMLHQQHIAFLLKVWECFLFQVIVILIHSIREIKVMHVKNMDESRSFRRFG